MGRGREQTLKGSATDWPVDMAQEAGEADLLERETIVDTDVHLSVPDADLAPYTDAPYDRYIERVRLADTSWDPSLGGKMAHNAVDDTPETIRENVIEGFNVDYPILNFLKNLSRVSNSETAAALMRACNDFMLDRFLDDTDLHGLATVALHRPDRAAEELDRIGDEDQIVGVFVVTAGPPRPLGDPSYDVMYRAAEDNDLPVVFHGATKGGFDREFPRQNQGFEQFIEAHVCAHLWEQSMTLVSLIVQGVPVKFPDLDFLVQEAGLAWVPYMMFRLNKEYAMRRSEAPLLEASPESYIRDRFYFASQPLGEPDRPGDLAPILEVLGADSIVFATDYPHWDFDHPSEIAKHLRSHFSAEEREAVLSGNAAEVFGIDV